MTINHSFKQQALLGTGVLLIILICITLLFAFNQWYHDWQLTHAPLFHSAPPINQDSMSLIASLPKQHLFGKSFEDSEVPISNLQLQVRGIVKVENDQNNFSKAYISIAGQPSKIYQLGDSLPDGVKIYDITEEAVILENEGRLEKLPLPREKLEFKPRNAEGVLSNASH